MNAFKCESMNARDSNDAGHELGLSSVVVPSVSVSDNSNRSTADVPSEDTAPVPDSARSRTSAAKELSAVRARIVNVLRLAWVVGPDAEDLAQQILLELARPGTALPALRGGELFARAAWLALLRSRTAFRSAATRQERERESTVHCATQGLDLEKLVIARDLLSLLGKMLDRLPESQHAVIVACVIRGMTHTEASVALGMPLGTVKSTLQTALARVNAMMRAEMPGEDYGAAVLRRRGRKPRRSRGQVVHGGRRDR